MIVHIDMNATMANEPSLRERRHAAGVSLQRLAEQAGVSISMVQLLDGGYQPKVSRVRGRILAALAELEREREGAAA